MTRRGSEPERRLVCFDDFLGESLPSLLRLAIALCGQRPLAEDVVQEVMLRAHQQWPRISAMDSPYGYVRTMIVHEHLAWRRKWSRQLPVDEIVGAPVPDHANHVVQRDDLLGRVDTLPAQQRAAVVLRYFADLPFDEIATALGCSQVTVRSYISRALATLRIQLAAESGASVRGEH